MKRKPPALLDIGIELDARAIEDFSCDCPVPLMHGCCHAFLKGHPFEGGELAFVDPPCLRRARKAPERHRYRCGYEGQDHLELLEMARSLPCSVMLCGCRSALYGQVAVRLASSRGSGHESGGGGDGNGAAQLCDRPAARVSSCGGCPESASGCEAQGGALGAAKAESRLSGLKSGFEQLRRSGQCSGQAVALFQPLLETMLMIWIERQTPKTPANSGLPSSTSATDEGARPKT